MQDYEKLGAFYLGREYDLEQSQIKDDLLLYDAKDLTTHAVCVGMTGSGKTGLCLSLLEEAAIDGIPAIVIDPKGDLGNLLLSFPELRPADFKPWIDAGEASRKGRSLEEHARKTAETWQQGLADWNQDGSRIERFRQAADISIYTPGSSAGIPLSVLKSFDAPPPELRGDLDAMRDRVQSATAGLLALLGIDADPVRSRDHILLANVLDQAWRAGRHLSLSELIGEIQSPAFDKVGVFDLESFYPSDARLGLAMRINNLLASPGFAAWMEGEPLHIGNLLYTSEGKPRISILSIAHLAESERMFFVTILLNELLAWTRTQSGSSSLRALLYMDEIFGYFPPSANPPSKKPMLTLLKQARAYGVGIMLATQNPVDLDYKGLSNTGTWFIGRLQTERDKMRVLDGLEGASASAGTRFDRSRMEAILASLGSRVFLMNNVHDDSPVIFHSRWALSYLRGPLTRIQIQKLMDPRKALTPQLPQALVAAPVASSATEQVVRQAKAKPATERPVLPAAIRQYFIPPSQALGNRCRLLYRPSILGTGRLHYVRSTAQIDLWQDLSLLGELPKRYPHVDWKLAMVFREPGLTFENAPKNEAEYGTLPAQAGNAKNFSAWEKDLKAHLYQYFELTVFSCKALKQYSKPGESEGEFRGRLAHAAKEKRDLAMEKLRNRYATKLATLRDRIRRAEERVEREQSQHGQQKYRTAISVGATLLGALFGRKLTSVGNVGRASTTMRGLGRASKEKDDIARAQDELEVQAQKLQELEERFEAELAGAREAFDPQDIELHPLIIRPRKSDITISGIGIVWSPWQVDADGIATPLFSDRS